MSRSTLTAGLALAAVALLCACDTAQNDPTGLVAVDLPSFAVANTTTGVPQGSPSSVFPSTNQDNLDNGWAHVTLVAADVEKVTLEFVQTRDFFSCVEYRLDDEAPTSTQNGGVNFNLEITDGLWEYRCLNGAGSTEQRTFNASDHVDIRLSFGAEKDERFDWTRFHVVPLDDIDQCKNDRWADLGFNNQGQCVRYVETGKDSRVGG